LKSKRILVIILMVALVSSVAAGAASLFNRPGNNNDVSAINARLNGAVDSCMQTLPTGTTTCDTQLGPVFDKICNPQSTSDQQRSQIDACHDGKVLQYYQIRNAEIIKTRNSTITNNSTMKG
jgi:hypothetical protein